MADATYTPSRATRGFRPLAAIGALFERIMDTSSRTAELDRLNAMSDAELARRGLRRDEVARYVFRDLIGF